MVHIARTYTSYSVSPFRPVSVAVVFVPWVKTDQDEGHVLPAGVAVRKCGSRGRPDGMDRTRRASGATAGGGTPIGTRGS